MQGKPRRFLQSIIGKIQENLIFFFFLSSHLKEVLNVDCAEALGS